MSNDREEVNNIPLYSDNSLAGKDNNCRIRKKANLNQNLQTRSNRTPTSNTNTDKYSEVEEYGNFSKNLPIHQQQYICRETTQYDLRDKKILQVNFLVGTNFEQIRRFPYYR